METFFDDIIIFSKSEEEHMKHVRMVLKYPDATHLVVNGNKSEFFAVKSYFLRSIALKDRVPTWNLSKLTGEEEKAICTLKEKKILNPS